MATPRKIKSGVPDLWMICREDSDSYNTSPNPKKLFTSVQMARIAAEELCQREGKRFYLLKVVAVVQTTTPPVLWTEAPGKVYKPIPRSR